MADQAIYRDLAMYYDLIYTWKDYKTEADTIKQLIATYQKSDGNTLLEAACGTWHHLEYFQKDFVCTGVDINQWILNVAKKKHKKIVFKKADMISLDLNKKFDIITCLFSSIGYVKTYANLEKTMNSFAKHLKTGGVVIIEPWFTADTYKAWSPHLTTYEDKDLKIARAVVSNKKGNLSIQNMHYLVAERNKEVKHYTDTHEMWLFEVEKTLAYMKKAWLTAKFLKDGLMKDRWLFIWVKK